MQRQMVAIQMENARKKLKRIVIKQNYAKIMKRQDAVIIQVSVNSRTGAKN